MLNTPPSWARELTDIASIHAGVTGVLAGFSITLVVLLAIERSREGEGVEPPTQAIVGLFLVSFVAFIASAIQYAIVPQREGAHRYLLYTLATTMYYMGGVLAFLGLSALMRFIRVRLLEVLGGITLAGAVIGGFLAAAIPYHDLHGVRQGILVSLFVIAAVVAPVSVRLLRKLLSHDQIIEIGLFGCCALLIFMFGFSLLSFFLPSKGIEKAIFITASGFPLLMAGLLTSYLTVSVAWPNRTP